MSIDPGSEKLTIGVSTKLSSHAFQKRMGSIVSVRLNRIVGEHEFILALRRRSMISFSSPLVRSFHPEGLLMLARHQPIHVTGTPESMRCIGGLHIFRLLALGLPGETMIPVLFYRRVSKRDIADSFFQDIFLLPIVFALNPNDRRHLAWQWQQQHNLSFLDRVVRNSGIRTLAQLLGADPRTLKGVNEDADLCAQDE